MNILLLNWRDPHNPKSGGAEIVTIEHAKAWVNAGHTVDWLAMQYPGCKDQELIDGVTILRKGNMLSVFLYGALQYLFSGKQYDVVIDEIHGIPFFTPLYVRKPKIAFIHEVAGDIWDYMYAFPINKLGKFLESFYFRLYTRIPFWTDAASTIDELVAKGIDRTMCVAIACPTDTTPVTELPKKESVPTFIFVSRLVKMKGIEDVLQAFLHIHTKDASAKLWIVGGGDPDYLSSLQSFVSTHMLDNSVTFWGFVPVKKKIELMRKAHVLLHASVKEGWGLVVLEAASQATPAVVYNVPGLRETVINKKTGVVISKNSPEDLAQQAQLLLSDKKTYEMYQKGGLVWVKSLTWEKATKQSLQLLNSVSKK